LALEIVTVEMLKSEVNVIIVVHNSNNTLEKESGKKGNSKGGKGDRKDDERN
jgi:hypothetical protein